MIIKPILLRHSTLDDLLNIDNPYSQSNLFQPELQLNKANASDTEAPLFGFLFLMALFHSKL